MSQNRLLYGLLKKAGAQGVHSHDLRREHSIGDPGRRAADLRERGFNVTSTQERRGNRHGVRYFLGYAEEGADGPASSALPGVVTSASPCAGAGGVERSEPPNGPGLASKGASANPTRGHPLGAAPDSSPSDGGGAAIEEGEGTTPIRYPIRSPKDFRVAPDWRDGWELVADYLDRSRPRWYWRLRP